MTQTLSWAQMRRDYRRKFALKQNAFAQDFNVSQPTVSRWERGERIPDSASRERLRAALAKQVELPDRGGFRMAMGIGPVKLAVWARSGRLISASQSFIEEIQSLVGSSTLVGLHADEIAGCDSLISFTADTLEAHGFFEGHIPSASLESVPYGNPERVRAGGTLITSIMPVPLDHGGFAMRCLYEHDVLRTPPAQPELKVMANRIIVYRMGGDARAEAIVE